MPHNISDHINAFIDLNGVPYLLGDYPDRNSFRQIDRSHIGNEIKVIEEEMKATVEISIDDIGRRCSDGNPNSIGNLTKQRRLLNIIRKHAYRLEHKLDVLRNGIIVVINYQLENATTNRIIRSAQETIRIFNRNYFVDINPKNINDNAIIINFYDHMISTINQFTHGTDRMLIRINNIKLFYECTKRDYIRNPYGEEPFSHIEVPIYQHHKKGPYHPNDDYYYQRDNQSFYNYCNDDENVTNNPSWHMYNRYYHFVNKGKSIDIHFDELNDINTMIFLLPCGNMDLNRTFIINPGHRIIFKLNIWKNDLILMEDTQLIADNLGIRDVDNYDRKQDNEIRKIWKALEHISKENNYYRPPKDDDCDCDSDSDKIFIPMSKREINRILNDVFKDDEDDED